jgi:hypothetical protein
MNRRATRIRMEERRREIYIHTTRQFYWPTFSSIKAEKEHGGGGEEKKLYK